MSPKKKSAARSTALPKDELIDALLQAEEDDGRSLEERLKTVTRAVSDGTAGGRATEPLKSRSHVRPPGAKPPPPPTAGAKNPDHSDPVFNFATEGKNEEREEVGAAPDAQSPAKVARLDVTGPYDFQEPAKLKAMPELAREKGKPSASPFDALRVEPRPSPEKLTENLSEKPVNEIEASVRSMTKSVSQKLESALKRLRSDDEAPRAGADQPASVIGDPARGAENVTTVPLKLELMPPASTPSPDDEKTLPMASAAKASTSASTGPAPTPNPQWADVKTELLTPETRTRLPEDDPEAERFMPTEIRANSPGMKFREGAKQIQPGAAVFSSAEAALRQSENLRVAQKRISDLEHELERVRRENENLRSAGETLRRRIDELQAQTESAEIGAQEARKIAEEEKKVLRGQIVSRDREIAEFRGRIDDAEGRLESNFRKIRVRERDLEHRIEIIKAESQSIAASKDRMILELKRQIDQLTSELNHAKSQVQETFGQFKERQETARRAVRALRIALTVLEGEDDPGSRKAE